MIENMCFRSDNKVCLGEKTVNVFSLVCKATRTAVRSSVEV